MKGSGGSRGLGLAALAAVVAGAGPSAFGGTVTGTVAWSEPTTFPSVAASRDPHVCGAEAPLFRRRVQVGAAGGVQGAVVTVADPKSPALPSRAVEVRIEGCQLVPRVLVLGVGSEVVFRSADPVLHNVTVRGPDGGRLASVNLVAAGQATPSLRLDRPGRYRVRSAAGHHWINGHIWVIARGHVTRSAREGRFALSGLSPGRHRLLAWHPDLGVAERTVSLAKTGTVSARLRF